MKGEVDSSILSGSTIIVGVNTKKEKTVDVVKDEPQPLGMAPPPWRTQVNATILGRRQNGRVD
jgi:hypothetical protein